jgi:hypothetical protein
MGGSLKRSAPPELVEGLGMVRDHAFIVLQTSSFVNYFSRPLRLSQEAYNNE